MGDAAHDGDGARDSHGGGDAGAASDPAPARDSQRRHPGLIADVPVRSRPAAAVATTAEPASARAGGRRAGDRRDAAAESRFFLQHSELQWRTRRQPPRDDNTWRPLVAYDGFDLRTWDVGSKPIFSFPPAAPVPPSSSDSTETSSSPAPQPLQHFHRFPDLPFELRSKIYRLSLCRPRVVVLRSLLLSPDPVVSVNEFGNPASDSLWYCQNRSPALVRVSREARAEALSFLRVHLPMRTPSLDRYGVNEEAKRNPVWDCIWINPECDLVLYDGTRRAVDFPVLASDILAYDPLGKGVAHLCSNDWPRSIWAVEADPGHSLSPLPRSLANLQTFVLFMRQVAGAPGRLGEGYVTGVNAKVGAGPAPSLGPSPGVDPSVSMNSIVRKALATKAPRRAADVCVVDMGMRAWDAYALPLYCATSGWALQLKWQGRDKEATSMMYVTTGAIRDPRAKASGDEDDASQTMERTPGLLDQEDLW